LGAWGWVELLEWERWTLSNEIQALRVQLNSVEKAIYETYQRFYKQDPTLRPKEAGQLGALWNIHDQVVFELQEQGVQDF